MTLKVASFHGSLEPKLLPEVLEIWKTNGMCRTLKSFKLLENPAKGDPIRIFVMHVARAFFKDFVLAQNTGEKI